MDEKLTAEELVRLGEQIAEQAVHLDAAMHRMLADLRHFDAAGGWYAQGFSSCAHWLSHRVGWDLATSREQLRVARALGGLPEVSAALAAGTLSYSKARAITRVATPALEETLLGYAQASTASQLETICRKYRSVESQPTDGREPLPRDDERYVIAPTTASGMVCVKALLRPEEAALLMQVIQQAAKDCKREAPGDSGDGSGREREDDGKGQGGYQGKESCADDAANACDASGVSAEARPGAFAARTTTPRQLRSFNRADGLMAIIEAYARGDSPQRAPVELILTTPAETLRTQPPAAAASKAVASSQEIDAALRSEDGSSCDPACACPRQDRGATIPVTVVAETDTYLSPETTRRLACDCGRIEATVDAQGQPLSVGRKTRTIPAAIKRALLLRDRTCRFPGCDHRLFLDGHHLRPWANGGETRLSNLALLCSRHHHYVHERGYRIEQRADGTLTFFDPRGKKVIAVAPRPSPAELGWPAIRSANAPLQLSAETSVGPRGGRLEVHEAVAKLCRVQDRAEAAPRGTSPESTSRPRYPTPWRRDGAPYIPPPRLAIEQRRWQEGDSADPDHDFEYAGRRLDDLLEWSLEELARTGIDPMATVPAPYAPPPGWQSKRG